MISRLKYSYFLLSFVMIAIGHGERLAWGVVGSAQPSHSFQQAKPREFILKLKKNVAVGQRFFPQNGPAISNKAALPLEKLHQKFHALKFQRLLSEFDRKRIEEVTRSSQGRFPMRTSRAKGKADAVDTGIDRLYILEVTEGMNPQEILKEYKSLQEVEYIEPNYTYHIQTTFPNDPRLGELWGLHNMGQSSGTVDADIDAPEAWDIVTGVASPVVVAVIDTGVDYTHPDLADHIWNNTGEIPGNGIDDDGNSYVDDVRGWDFVNSDNDPMDDHGHGTHVSGTIAAKGNNGLGVAGVTWGVTILPLKFISSGGSGTISAAVSAIYYAAQSGADIMSNSWGGTGYSQALQDAINYATDLGVLFVAAAGNSGMDASTFFPAAMDNVFTVAATDRNDVKAVFSNFGSVVEVSAPGVDILSTVPPGSCVLCDASGYKTLSGTSMAAPHVSGVAALLLSMAPGLSLADLGNFIKSSADDINPENPGYIGQLGAGRLNAFLAVSSPTGVYATGFSIDDDSTGLSHGDGDGRWENQETIEFTLGIRNMSSGTIMGVTGQITTQDPYVTILQPSSDFGDIPSRETSSSQFPFVLKLDTPPLGYPSVLVHFTLQDNLGRTWGWDMNIPVAQPNIVLLNSQVDDDSAGQSSGNGNGVAETGETIEWRVTFANKGLGDAHDVMVTLTSSSEEISLLQTQAFLGNIAQGIGTATGVFTFSLPAAITRPGEINLTLNTSIQEGAFPPFQERILRNILVKKISVIHPSSFRFPYTSVSGNQVVWRQEDSTTPGYSYGSVQVMVYDIPSGTIQAVHKYAPGIEFQNTVTSSHRMMQLHQGKVVYGTRAYDYNTANWTNSVWLFDLATRELRQLATRTSPLMINDIRYSVSGEQIAWLLGGPIQNLNYYNLATSQLNEFVVSTFSFSGSHFQYINGLACGKLVGVGVKNNVPVVWGFDTSLQQLTTVYEPGYYPLTSSHIDCLNQAYFPTFQSIIDDTGVPPAKIWSKNLNTQVLTNLPTDETRPKYTIDGNGDKGLLAWGDYNNTTSVVLYDRLGAQKEIHLSYDGDEYLFSNDLTMDDNHIAWTTWKADGTFPVYLATVFGLGATPPPDTTPPLVSVSHAPLSPSSTQQVTFSASASDSSGISEIKIFVDGVLAKTCLSETSCLLTSGPFLVGNHIYSATAKDATSNQNQNSTGNLSLTVLDRNPPIVAITSPPSGAEVGITFTVSGTASDNVGVARVEIQIDGGDVKIASGTAQWTLSLNTAGLSTGAHSLLARAVDSSGNTATQTITINVTYTDQESPIVQILYPSTGDNVKSPVPVSFSGSDNVAVSRVELWADGNLAASQGFNPPVPSFSIILTFKASSTGLKTLQAKAFDPSNNVGSATITVKVVKGRLGYISLVTSDPTAVFDPDGGKPRALMISPGRGYGQMLLFDEDVTEARLLDINGRITLKKEKQGGPLMISLQEPGGLLNLESGIYFIQIKKDNGEKPEVYPITVVK
ncbi:MAG: S8 family serine peptidase [Elusimicrobia bacterium]|nr:S8 family serine peptidase [Elusimicrobiota bacterium]